MNHTSPSNLAGTRRRFLYRGKTLLGALVYDDDAQHPLEIKASIERAKKIPEKIITVVFQPHLYSQTKLLCNDLVDELGKAGDIVLLPILGDTEVFDPTISSEMLAAEIAKKNPGMDPKVFNDLEIAARWLSMIPKEESIILVMGPNDVSKLADELLKNTERY